MKENKIYGKRKRKILQGIRVGFLSFGLFAYTLAGLAQQIDVETFFSRDTILIGDQLDFTLQVTQPDTLHLQIPAYADSIVSGVDIIKQLRNDTIRDKNHRLQIERRYRVSVFDTGVVVIPPVEVSYKANGIKATLSSQPVKLVVKTLPVDLHKGLKDIKRPYNMPLTLKEILFWALMAILLAGTVFFLFWYRRKKKQKDRLPKIVLKPTEPPHVFALREMNILKDARLWQQGQVKEYYTRLTDILRKYLEYRYEIKAMEQTSIETMESLTKAGFNDNRLYSMLKEILDTGDLVKFAKYLPQPDKNESMLLNAFVFVNETKKAWKKESEPEEKNELLKEEQEESEGSALMQSEKKQERKEGEDHA